jgi:hypothetical protein
MKGDWRMTHLWDTPHDEVGALIAPAYLRIQALRGSRGPGGHGPRAEKNVDVQHFIFLTHGARANAILTARLGGLREVVFFLKSQKYSLFLFSFSSLSALLCGVCTGGKRGVRFFFNVLKQGPSQHYPWAPGGDRGARKRDSPVPRGACNGMGKLMLGTPRERRGANGGMAWGTRFKGVRTQGACVWAAQNDADWQGRAAHGGREGGEGGAARARTWVR